MRLVDDAVGSFKTTVRLHSSWIGTEGIRVLHDVLKRRDIYTTGPFVGYVELRSRLRMHLRDPLQLQLMGSGEASDEMKGDQMGRDLGL